MSEEPLRKPDFSRCPSVNASNARTEDDCVLDAAGIAGVAIATVVAGDGGYGGIGGCGLYVADGEIVES